MSLSQLQMHSHQSNGVTFVDPKDPQYQVRFKTSENQKFLDGVRTTNYVTEIIATDVNTLDADGVKANDALSVRIRVSGSVGSMEKLKQMVTNQCNTLVASWLEENVLLGFEPGTPPVNGE